MIILAFIIGIGIGFAAALIIFEARCADCEMNLPIDVLNQIRKETENEN